MLYCTHIDFVGMSSQQLGMPRAVCGHVITSANSGHVSLMHYGLFFMRDNSSFR